MKFVAFVLTEVDIIAQLVDSVVVNLAADAQINRTTNPGVELSK